MSHFTTLVILNADDVRNNNLDTLLRSALAPFDENMEVPEYTETCHCVGRVAKKEIQGRVADELGTIDEARDTFNDNHPDIVNPAEAIWKQAEAGKDEDAFAKYQEMSNEIDVVWQSEVISVRKAHEQKLLDAHPEKDTPRPDCDDCSGSGSYLTKYNPDSKWDWYEVGGRWALDMNGSNMRPVAEIAEMEYLPFAIVTASGEWYAKGKMGWWAVVHDRKSKDDHKDACLAIYEKHKRGYEGVLCNLHI